MAWQGTQETESSALNSSSRFFFLPISLLPQVYGIVLCCTWTIHKGYYIVLHSFPILQLSLFYVQALSSSIFFSSTGVQNTIFMVGYQ